MVSRQFLKTTSARHIRVGQFCFVLFLSWHPSDISIIISGPIQLHDKAELGYRTNTQFFCKHTT